jgi:hypothetical protein
MTATPDGRGNPGAAGPVVFGPGPDVLLLNGEPLCALAVARGGDEAATGLLGTDAVDGALWIDCQAVHMRGMRYPIQVARLDKRGRVLKVATITPGWRPFKAGSLLTTTIVEAAVGALDTVRPGDTLAIQTAAGDDGKEAHDDSE